ncbi:MAG: hypothetical protein ACE5Q6_09280, partial [Dehalococcoidia bacterium]
MVSAEILFKEPPVQWLTAAPLWPRLEEGGWAFRSPAILRFASDNFMEEFLTVAATAPHRLGEWRVQRESWRKPLPTPPVVLPRGLTQLPPVSDISDTSLANQPLKLYQPGHPPMWVAAGNVA